MAEKTRRQWLRAFRRWLSVGAVTGLGFGVFAFVAWGGRHGLLGSLAFYVPMGAALVVMLWASVYRYDFHEVWGGVPTLITVGVMLGLIALGVGVGCLQGVCGER